MENISIEPSILKEAGCSESWLAFLHYKLEKQHLSRREEALIQDFIDREGYLSLCRQWEHLEFPSSFPTKRIINKEGTQKKRIVYSFEGDTGLFLKYIAWQLFRYDDFFCSNCYAFRRNYGVKNAFRRILQEKNLSKKYCLKVDISNYFNSIDVDILLQKLLFIKDSDAFLYQLLERLLSEQKVWENGKLISDCHGAMAGTPISPFLANIYLTETDRFFEKENVLYFRYSDDILLFADSEEELLLRREQLYEQITALGLTLNPEKITLTRPGEAWEFLGFCYHNGEIDLSENTLRKIKAKIKRKAAALRRWQRSKGLSEEKAAIGFIRAMNLKFFGSQEQDTDDFTWAKWFFPNLTVDTGLRKIDAYMQQYIRYTITGRHFKGNYRIRYETLKKWGYRNLVHEFYQSHKDNDNPQK